MTNVKPDIACLACQSSKTELTPYIDKPFYGDDIIDFSKMQICFCWDCGFGCSIPEVEGNLLDKFYSIQYRAKSSIHFIDFPRLTKPKISQCKQGIEHLLLARHFTKVESGDNFLDIGPGPGWHFPAALSLLENPNLFAIEYNQMAAVSYSQLYGAKTFSGFEGVKKKLGSNQFKFIVSSHSLEHFSFSGLKVLLNEVHDLLLSDGVFLIEVPHADMRIHSKIRLGDSPHLLFFTIESLRSILIDSGFEVFFIETTGQLTAIEADINQDIKHEINDFNSLISFIYSKFPLWFKTSKFKLDVKNFFIYLSNSSTKINLSELKVNYGGNRSSIRVIAKKKGY